MLDVKRYKTGKLLGKGGFGAIYAAVDTETNTNVAVKFELLTAPTQLLPYEAWVYEKLQGVKGIPNIHYFGVEDSYNVMVLDLLGDSLSNKLHNTSGKCFSLQCVCALADKIIGVIGRFHDAGFVHRDIKPSNFVLGTDTNSSSVYLLDFGLSKSFRADTGEHIPYRDGKRWLGTARYSSISAHRGDESCRKDDMESIGYMLISFIRGALPWDDTCVSPNDPSQAKTCLRNVCCSKQQHVQHKTLCQGLPPVFQTYFDYVHSLTFYDTPNYVWLRRLFRRACQELKVDPPLLDWID